jgi:hypothetical protein
LDYVNEQPDEAFVELAAGAADEFGDGFAAGHGLAVGRSLVMAS